MKWKVLDTGISSAEENMAADASLLNEVSDCKNPTLHLYGWEGLAATYGYFSKPDDLLNLEAIAANSVQLARRPTGGGVLFHFTDFAFSIIVPKSHPFYSTNTLRNYASVNRVVEHAVRDFIGAESLFLEEDIASKPSARHFCMGKPTKYDLIRKGKKIAGAAQRRTKEGLLHQGTIHLALPNWDDLSSLIKDSSVLDAMRLYSAGLVDFDRLPKARKEIKRLLIEKFCGADV
ncbi:uncharacterized protein yqhM [Waddlia chondrophila 2032/99]|uniref:Uncharacterized protein yqhM n=1 Tax=Waddlia chondrophila 2032/99 TaxID=765953 RepID=F8LCD7_9BACT|nr:uncharacterized protein yqhM [Waddlia chondrophila 2032/99]